MPIIVMISWLVPPMPNFIWILIGIIGTKFAIKYSEEVDDV